MPINLSNVNVSIAEFQRISSGEVNAGEVRLKNDHALEKVNNHVGALRGFNVTPLSHEEIFAVKSAFVRALGAGGVQQDDLNRIRAELGLGADNGADAQSLRERSIKPLTRQQVREILDRCADALNAHDGAGTIRTEAQMTEGLSERERNARRASREAANNALAGNRAVDGNRDIALFTRLVAGDFAGVSHDDSLRMIEMAQSKIAAARAKYAGAPLPTDDARTLTVQWELPGGQRIDFSVRTSTADFVGKMEDAIFALRNSARDAEGNLTGLVPTEERNKAIRDALAYPTQQEILPHGIRVMVDELLAAARQKFGAEIVPEGARICEVAVKEQIFPLINDLGAEAPVGADDLRGGLGELLVDACIQKAADKAIDEESGRRGVKVQNGLGRRFLQREPQLAAALRDAVDAGGVAAAFAAFRDQLQRFVAFAASVTSFTQTGFYEAAADKLAAGLGNAIPRSSLLAQIRNWADVGPAVDEMGAKIISGEIAAESLEDVERLFRDKAAEMMGRRIDLFRSIDALRDELPRQLSDRFKTDALRLQSFDPKTYNIGAFVAVAKKPAFASALATLNATLSKPGLDREEGYAALRTFYDGLLELVESELGEHVYGFDTQTQAFQAVLRIATKGDEAPLKAAHDFFLRDDVANDDLHMKPFVSAIQLMNSLSFGGVTNDDILAALDKGGLAPMHAKALADAVRDSGIAGLDGDQAVALFATANPAGRALAEVIQSAPDGISPQELYSFAVSVLRNHSQSIADGTAAVKLLVPLDAHAIAERAYAKAPGDPATVDRLVAAAFSACGADGTLRAIVRSNIESILADGDGLRTEDQVRARIGGFRDNLDELRENLYSSNRFEAFFDVGREFLANAGAAFPRGVLTKVFRVALNLPNDSLAGLDGHSNIVDLHRALAQVDANVGRLTAGIGDADLAAVPDRAKAFGRLVAGCMVLGLVENRLQGVHDAIRSQNAGRIVRGYAAIRNYAAGRRGANHSPEFLDGLETSGRRLAALLEELNGQLCLRRELDAAQNPVPAIDGNLRPADYDADGLLAAMAPHVQNPIEAV